MGGASPAGADGEAWVVVRKVVFGHFDVQAFVKVALVFVGKGFRVVLKVACHED